MVLKRKKKIKKSSLGLFGLIIISIGIIIVSYDFVLSKKEKAFNEMNIKLFDSETPIVANDEDIEPQEEIDNTNNNEEQPKSKTKKINYITTIDTIFYTYELTSSFNSENAINYFDNQRAKATGNIGSGEYISRNIDIQSDANIIFYDTTATEIEIVGDNTLEAVLEAPFVS